MVTTTDSIEQAIKGADERLLGKYGGKLHVNNELNRTLVSFQANRLRNGYRWYKYKEGFSSDLVRYVLRRTGIVAGLVMDPFAGSGATLLTASELGVDSIGIELLPSSAEIIAVKSMLRSSEARCVTEKTTKFRKSLSWQEPGPTTAFAHLRITKDAFPPETERELGRYLHEISKIEDSPLRRLLFFAALCILEDISYTRKDGQYLRWDYRSGRNVGKEPFSKGTIASFTPAICAKLDQIVSDVSQGQMNLPGLLAEKKTGSIRLLRGSCLDILPQLPTAAFDGIITSPPYCNRYDYTRTYALELAMMGVGEQEIRSLRQAMLSCTVENRDKESLGESFDPTQLARAMTAFESHELLGLIVQYLEVCKQKGTLNNNGVPRMVRNYFKELTAVIFECARILKPGGSFVMVNDNVRYQGINIPVDLILADMAQQAGLSVEAIWVLPVGKGNSSQQMKTHGREELRKCVYVWRRY